MFYVMALHGMYAAITIYNFTFTIHIQISKQENMYTNFNIE